MKMKQKGCPKKADCHPRLSQLSALNIKPKPSSHTRGSVLMTVVWTLSMLAVFTVAVNRRASQDLLFGSWMRDKVMERTLAKAAIDRVLYEAQADEFLTFDAPSESWASHPDGLNNVRIGAGTFNILCDPDPEVGSGSVPMAGRSGLLYGACDESARINLNTATQETLQALFKLVISGLEETEALRMAQAVIDWRDTDDANLPEGAEKNVYAAMNPPYAPRNGNFESVWELSMVRGFDLPAVRQLEPYLTVYTGGKVNFNTASRTVLRAMGLEEGLAQKVADFRKGEDGVLGTEDDGIFQLVDGITPALSTYTSMSSEEFKQIANNISAGTVSVTSDAMRVHAFGRLIQSRTVVDNGITCVITREGQILYWKEGNL